LLVNRKLPQNSLTPTYQNNDCLISNLFLELAQF
jgi:hypothetical protein